MQEKDKNAYITGLMKILNQNVKDFADEIIDKKKKILRQLMSLIDS